MSANQGGLGPPAKQPFVGNNVTYQFVYHDSREEIVNPNPINQSEDETVSINPIHMETNLENTEASSSEKNDLDTGSSSNIETEVKKKPIVKYSYKSKGPFEVYLEYKSPDKNIGNFHLLSLAKMIQDRKVENVKTMNRKGKNRIGVIFKNYTSANSFVDQYITDKEYNVFIPYNKVTRKGIIKYVDLDFKEDEIVKYSTCNVDKCEILEARRLSRKHIGSDKVVSYKPTSTVCITFSGSQLPKEIFVCGLRFSVSTYHIPVVQCYNCMLFGHTKKLCRGKKRCINCGLIEHDNQTLCKMSCFHCKSGDHNGINRICPEYERQKKIKKVMSTENRSFFEANELIPPILAKARRSPSLQSEEFPLLPENNPPSDVYQVHEQIKDFERRNPGPSYSAVASIPKRRRPDLNRSNSFDREPINKALISPNGRLPNVPKTSNAEFSFPRSNTSPYFHPGTQASHSRGSPHTQRIELEQKTLQDIITVASMLPLSERSQVLNFMTQLESLIVSYIDVDPDEL